METSDSTPATPTPRTAPDPKAARIAASAFSSIFSPLLVPTYGVILALWLTFLVYLPAGMRWTVVAVTFVSTCILPLTAIIALWKLGMIRDPQLNNRTERTVPYVVTGLCYLGCGLFFATNDAPSWLWALMIGGAIATMVCIIVNMRWKISAHMAAMGGLLALMFRIAASGMEAVRFDGWLSMAVIVAGCVGSSRVFLERHTLWQVIAGTAVGFLCVFILSMN